METEPISFCYPFKGENIERVFTVLSNQSFVIVKKNEVDNVRMKKFKCDLLHDDLTCKVRGRVAVSINLTFSDLSNKRQEEEPLDDSTVLKTMLWTRDKGDCGSGCVTKLKLWYNVNGVQDLEELLYFKVQDEIAPDNYEPKTLQKMSASRFARSISNWDQFKLGMMLVVKKLQKLEMPRLLGVIVAAEARFNHTDFGIMRKYCQSNKQVYAAEMWDAIQQNVVRDRFPTFECRRHCCKLGQVDVFGVMKWIDEGTYWHADIAYEDRILDAAKLVLKSKFKKA